MQHPSPTSSGSHGFREPLHPSYAALGAVVDHEPERRPPRQPRPRTLLVSPQPFYEDRGTPIAVRHALKALTELGYDVDLLTFPVGRDVEIPGVRILRAPNPFRIRHVPVGFSLRKVALDLGLFWKLARLLRRDGYACVHAVEESAFAAILLQGRRRLPVIYDMASSLPEQLAAHRPFRGRAAQALLRRCERWLLARVDLVVSSAGLADRARRLVDGVRVREWRFPAFAGSPRVEEGSALRASLGIAPDARVILYSGTFESYQGLESLLAAVPLVVNEVPAAVFVLVGAQAERDAAALQQAHQLVRQGFLRVVDRQPRERMPSFLAMAEVLVSPRAYGGNLPLKIFDYLAAGRPIVATDIPTHRTVLGEDHAVLVEPTPEAFGRMICELLRDRARAARLGAAARAYAQRHLGWDPYVRFIASLYAEAIAARRVGPDA